MSQVQPGASQCTVFELDDLQVRAPPGSGRRQVKAAALHFGVPVGMACGSWNRQQRAAAAQQEPAPVSFDDDKSRHGDRQVAACGPGLAIPERKTTAGLAPEADEDPFLPPLRRSSSAFVGGPAAAVAAAAAACGPVPSSARLQLQVMQLVSQLPPRPAPSAHQLAAALRLAGLDARTVQPGPHPPTHTPPSRPGSPAAGNAKAQEAPPQQQQRQPERDQQEGPMQKQRPLAPVAAVQPPAVPQPVTHSELYDIWICRDPYVVVVPPPEPPPTPARTGPAPRRGLSRGTAGGHCSLLIGSGLGGSGAHRRHRSDLPGGWTRRAACLDLTALAADADEGDPANAAADAPAADAASSADGDCDSSGAEAPDSGGDATTAGPAAAADGAPAPPASPPAGVLLVEPGLRDLFRVAAAQATPEYAQVVARLPAVWVGPRSALLDLAGSLTHALEANFRCQGLDVPPWRRRCVMLARWDERHVAAALAAQQPHLGPLVPLLRPAAEAAAPALVSTPAPAPAGAGETVKLQRAEGGAQVSPCLGPDIVSLTPPVPPLSPHDGPHDGPARSLATAECAADAALRVGGCGALGREAGRGCSSGPRSRGGSSDGSGCGDPDEEALLGTAGASPQCVLLRAAAGAVATAGKAPAAASTAAGLLGAGGAGAAAPELQAVQVLQGRTARAVLGPLRVVVGFTVGTPAPAAVARAC
ncbi:hypothetical protein HYH03_010515 [Edaphochlamys debaryana]|uniref:Uncharacterized protein n=1 Tax=Edaphochlamys debaryana TaxID=47281 RepID=A0A835XWD7_9CHLO|nr:hypothetical protein HYH03_010515 [Edaphochlamys debaryana]|eukprot:KAG2491070.1 hypothetical protein HYH03_010515 [Edaphochlamys debaryana]